MVWLHVICVRVLIDTDKIWVPEMSNMTNRIQIASDFHCEFYRDHGVRLVNSMDSIDVDILVLAGDIVCLKKYHQAKEIFEILCSKYPQVIYTPGNHEYYTTSVTHAEANLARLKADFDNLHILHQGLPTVVNGQCFIGGTLWFKRDSNNILYKNMLNDFNYIKGFEPWVYDQNELTIYNLNRHMVDADIVVTHHLPSDVCVAPKYKTDNLNRFFVCDMSDVILDIQPKMWIYGHTHTGLDCFLGKTRLISNPKGYPSEINNPYDTKLVID